MTCQSGGNGCGAAGCLTASWESVNGPSWGCWGSTASVAAEGTAGSFASFCDGSCYIHPFHHAESGRGKSLDLCPGNNMASGSLCGCPETPVGSGTPVCGSVHGCGVGNGILIESET